VSEGWVITPPATPGVAVSGTDRAFPVRRIFCVGRNYAEHAREMGMDPEREPPFFFTKPADAVTAAVERLRTTEATQAADRATQCWLLGSYQLSTGDWRNAYTAFDAVCGLTPGDLQEVLDRWVRFGGWGIMADTSTLENPIPGPWPLR